MITLYGIPNCDSVKKAQVFLNVLKIQFAFHDFKKQGIAEKKLKEWVGKQPIETLLNKKSTTWKALTDEEKKTADTLKGALMLLLNHTNLIKRPVVEVDEKLLVGYNADIFKVTFSIKK